MLFVRIDKCDKGDSDGGKHLPIVCCQKLLKKYFFYQMEGGMG